jgi:Ti type entry exclusion protein TrbK
VVRAKLILIVVALLAVGAGSGWLLVSGREDAEQRAAGFLSSSKEFPTTGGQKMKPEW